MGVRKRHEENQIICGHAIDDFCAFIVYIGDAGEDHNQVSKHILIVLKAVAALFGCGYGFFDFSLEKKIRKQ